MKKAILVLMPFTLAACSSQVQQSSVPMDMQAVRDYQQRVATGQTKSEHWELNSREKQQKIVVEQRARIQPSLHYGYGWGRHHTGIGVGLGSLVTDTSGLKTGKICKKGA